MSKDREEFTIRNDPDSPPDNLTRRDGTVQPDRGTEPPPPDPAARTQGAQTGEGALHLEGFNVLRQFEARGGEADIFLVLQGGTQAILKLYRFGINPKMEILQAMVDLSRAHPECFVQMQYFGYHPQTRRFFELQEFAREGALSDVLEGNPLPVDTVRTVVSQLEHILSTLHEHDILHLDLKPGNVLIRQKEPLQIVLTDFGIASILGERISKKLTEVKGTSLYQSPESIIGIVGRKSDWWSLGMLILELLTGKNPFESLNRQVVYYHLTTKGVPIPDGLPDRWRTLAQGLLTRNPDQRWAGPEVKRWLAGEDVPVFLETGTEESADHGPSEAPQTPTVPFQFLGSTFHRLEELVPVFTSTTDAWNQGKVQLAKGYILKWLEDNREYEKAGRISEILDQESSMDFALFRVIYTFRKDLPIAWQGVVLTERQLLELLQKAIMGGLTHPDQSILDAFFQLELSRTYEMLTENTATDGHTMLGYANAMRGTGLASLSTKEKAEAMILAANESLAGAKPMNLMLEAIEGQAESAMKMRIAAQPGFVDFGVKIGLVSYQESLAWRLACHLYDRRKDLIPPIVQVLKKFADNISAAIVVDGSLEELLFLIIAKKSLGEETIKTIQIQRMGNPWLLELVRANLGLGDFQDMTKFLEMYLLHYRAIEKRETFGKFLIPPFFRPILSGPDVAYSHAFIIRKLIENPQRLPGKGKYRMALEPGKFVVLQEWADLEIGLKALDIPVGDFSTVESIEALRMYLEMGLVKRTEQAKQKTDPMDNTNIRLAFLISLVAYLATSSNIWIYLWIGFTLAWLVTRPTADQIHAVPPEDPDLKQARLRLIEEAKKTRKRFRPLQG